VTDAACIAAPLVDLREEPDGPRARQLLLGAPVAVLDRDGIWARVRADLDGYEGWVAAETLGPVITPTHCVSAPATHVYSAPDFKSPERMALSLGARLQVIGDTGRFWETPLGFVPHPHLRDLTSEPDPVAVAERLLGTPYLWGGNSRWGIDCSGLVQLACTACGIACPGDSGPQETALGETLDADTPMRRGDLIFWKGHVAWVAGPDTILHANAYHMAVAYEPMQTAIDRIAAQGDGSVTRRARLSLSVEAHP